MLSVESKKVLYSLYSEYKKRRKSGTSRSESRDFSTSPDDLHRLFFDKSKEDASDILYSLSDNGYIDLYDYGDDIVDGFFLTENAIAEIESLPASALLSIADFISKFI